MFIKKRRLTFSLLSILLTAFVLFVLVQREANHSHSLYPKDQAKTSKSTPYKSQDKVLFSDPLSGTDRIVTNEFNHWNKNSACPYKSDIWDMTSGTLLIKNGMGYSGVPTSEKKSICDSTVQNNSAIFRLNTKQNNFSNATVSLDYMPIQHGGGGATNHSYDGIHVWVGYKTQYSLYIATIFRWDENLVIKKKVPQAQAQCTDPANEGCYYNLTDEKPYPDITTANVWHHADIKFAANTNEEVTITERIDGQTVFQGTDTNIHGPAYTSGAVGVRGDNTEFYFKNFTVTQL